jgi:hypothetical protein
MARIRRLLVLGVVCLASWFTPPPVADVTQVAVRPIVPTILALPAPTFYTLEPTATLTSTPTALPTPTPTPLFPLDTTLNGVPLAQIIVLPLEVIANIRDIFGRGQAFGRNPRAFSRLGDSTIQNPHFLMRFDQGSYDLGAYAYLQPAIDYFAGSFEREGYVVWQGLHSWSVFDPFFVDGECAPDETPLDCELRLHNPSILLIRIGVNDAGVDERFESSVRRIIEHCLEQGVIPVLGTKPDRRAGTLQNNDILRRLAAEYAVPLWDLDAALAALPNRGLIDDQVHLETFYTHDYTQEGALLRGQAIQNLTALFMLDALWRLGTHDQ